jgi:CheY-like chemotaxis protein
MPPPGEYDDPLELDMQRLRETAQPEIERRLQVIEDYVVVWKGGQLAPDRMWAAQREAHRLVGSLGMLGFEGATDLARRLDRILRTSAQADPAIELLAALRREVARGPAPEEEAPPVGSTPQPTRAAQILLAEDDQTVASAVRVALRLDGLDLLWARDGAEAVNLAREYDVDLVLLDLGLPVLDGLEVCRRLRDDPRLAATPIVLMTAHPDVKAASGGSVESGVTAYIAKPFKVADLRQRVRTLLAASPPAPAG